MLKVEAPSIVLRHSEATYRALEGWALEQGPTVFTATLEDLVLQDALWRSATPGATWVVRCGAAGRAVEQVATRAGGDAGVGSCRARAAAADCVLEDGGCAL